MENNVPSSSMLPKDDQLNSISKIVHAYQQRRGHPPLFRLGRASADCQRGSHRQHLGARREGDPSKKYDISVEQLVIMDLTYALGEHAISSIHGGFES
jgi:hypothetical protein